MLDLSVPECLDNKHHFVQQRPGLLLLLNNGRHPLFDACVGLHEGFVGLHEGFVALHEGFVGLREGFVGLREDSVGLREDSVGLSVLLHLKLE